MPAREISYVSGGLDYEMHSTPYYDQDHDTTLQDRWSDRYDLMLSRIPEHEMLTLSMTLSGHTQEKIAGILGITQGAVSYRIHSAIRRLKWLDTLPDLYWNDQELYRRLQAIPGMSDTEIQSIYTYIRTTSQTEAAKTLKKSQTCYRWVLSKATRFTRLKDKFLHELLCSVRDNPLIMHDFPKKGPTGV